jgi:acyl dehydratase
MARYFEDIDVGERRALGEHTFGVEGIVEFGERFDPQPMHTDPEAARESPLGGLIASGWHTGSVTMRLLVDSYLSELAVVAGKGVDRLRWPTPVRPGDTLEAEVEVVGKDPDRPERGTVRMEVTGNTDSGTAISLVALGVVARHSPPPDSEPDSGAD